MIEAKLQFVVPGYSHIRLEPRTSALVLTACTGAVREILASGTLYDYAASYPERETMHGRAPVYKIPLSWCGAEVVVRRNRRGGLLRHILSDQFFITTRAIRELDNALYLKEYGIPTPEVVALVTYREGLLKRADVATRYIPASKDLANAYFEGAPEQRAYMLDAVAELLDLMARRGVHHPDLNAKNVLIVPFEDDYKAYVLDVDRVALERDPATVRKANLERLVRSLRKLRWPADAVHYLEQQARG